MARRVWLASTECPRSTHQAADYSPRQRSGATLGELLMGHAEGDAMQLAGRCARLEAAAAAARFAEGIAAVVSERRAV